MHAHDATPSHGGLRRRGGVVVSHPKLAPALSDVDGHVSGHSIARSRSSQSLKYKVFPTQTMDIRKYLCFLDVSMRLSLAPTEECLNSLDSAEHEMWVNHQAICVGRARPTGRMGHDARVCH